MQRAVCGNAARTVPPRGGGGNPAVYSIEVHRAEKWSVHTGAGNWPDADMLPVGPIRQDYDKNDRTHFTEDEQYTMMTLWSIFRSPLMIGGEMTGFDDFGRDEVPGGEYCHRSLLAHQEFG